MYIQWKLLSHEKVHIRVSSNEVDEPRAYYTSEVGQKDKNDIIIKAYTWDLERWCWWTYM